MNEKEKPKLSSYIIGFALCLVLTLTAYALVYFHVNSGHESLPHAALIPAILVLAIFQFLVQSVFFLHLTSGSRWNLVVFVSTLGILLVIVIGSLWIMAHLNYNMMPDQMNQELRKQEGF